MEEDSQSDSNDFAALHVCGRRSQNAPVRQMQNDHGEDFEQSFVVAVPRQAEFVKRKKPLGVPGPKKREKVQHMLVMERARAGKRDKKHEREQQEILGSVESVVANVWRKRPLGVRRSGVGKSTIDQLRQLHRFSKKSLKGSFLSEASDVKIAFDKTIRVSDASKLFGIDLKHVQRARSVVAYTARRVFAAYSQRWVEFCGQHPPVAVFCARKWDEAKSKLRLDLVLPGVGKLPADRGVMPLNVLQSRMVLYIAWEDRVVQMHLPRAPVPVVSTAAEVVHSAMDTSPQSKPCEDFFRALASTAQFSACIDGEDGAYSNIRYSQWWANTSNIPHSYKVCQNHENARTENLILDVCGPDYRSKLYSMATLFRSSTYFLRLTAVVEPVLQEVVVIVQDDPPPSAILLSDLIVQHMVDHFESFKMSYAEKGGSVSWDTRRQRVKDMWTTFVRLFNGCFWAHAKTHSDLVVYHFSSKPVDRSLLVKQMSRAFVSVILRHLPTKPEEGKWTKLAPANDWFFCAKVFFNALGILMQKAFKDIPQQAVTQADLEGGVTFSTMQGVRLTASRELANSREAYVVTVILMVMLRVSRYLTMYLLRCSRDFRSACTTSPVLDLANPAASPVTAATQHLAFLSTGLAPQLRFVWQSLGHQSMHAFTVACPDNARLLRVAIYVAAASIQKRHRLSYLDKLLRLVDPRTPSDQAIELQMDYDKKVKDHQVCCTGVVAFEMRAKFQVRSGFHNQFQQALRGLTHAMDMTLSVADIERRHRRTKTLITTEAVHFGHYAAKSYLEEVRMVSVRAEMHAHALVEALGAPAVPVQPLEALSNGTDKKQKKKSAYDIFVQTKLKEATVRGDHKKSMLFSKAGRQKLRQQWCDLPEDDRTSFEEQAFAEHHVSPFGAPSSSGHVRRKVAQPAAIMDTPKEQEHALAVWVKPSEVGSLPIAQPPAKLNLSACCARCKGPERSIQVHASMPPASDASGVWHYAPSSKLAEVVTANSESVMRAAEEPFHVQHYADFKKQHHITKATAEEYFKGEMSKLAAAEHTQIPRNMTYKFECVGFCRTKTDPKLLEFRDRVQAEINLFVNNARTKHHCKLQALPLFEYLFALELIVDFHRELKYICQLAIAYAKSGPRAAYQGFILFDIPECTKSGADGDDLAAGLASHIILPSHHAHIPSLRSCTQGPMEGQNAARLPSGGWGALRTVDNSELIHGFLESLAAHSTEVQERAVAVITLLDHDIAARHDRSDARRIVGCSAEYDRIVIPFLAPPKAKAASRTGGNAGDFSSLAYVRRHKPVKNEKAIADQAAAANPVLALANHADEDAEEPNETSSSSSSDDADGGSGEDGDGDDFVDAVMPSATVDKPIDRWKQIQKECGVVEGDCGSLYDAASGHLLGRIEVISSTYQSLNAICRCHVGQEAKTASLGKKGAKPVCFLLVGAMQELWTKYAALIRWLKLGPTTSAAAHAAASVEVKDSLKRTQRV